jgi:GNAT superfamily N-acetyltransferase
VLGERDEKSWYLVYLGTRPSARGKGYARRLVEYVTDQVPISGPCVNELTGIGRPLWPSDIS